MQDSTIISLAGLAVALLISAMGYFWSYRTRGYPHREFLYQRQIDEYKELSAALSRSVNSCYNCIFGKGKITTETREEFMKIIERAIDDLNGQFWKSAAIVPSDVALAVMGFISKLATEIPKLEYARQILESLLQGEWEVYAAIWKNVGVEPLTREMLRSFGQRSQ